MRTYAIYLSFSLKKRFKCNSKSCYSAEPQKKRRKKKKKEIHKPGEVSSNNRVMNYYVFTSN